MARNWCLRVFREFRVLQSRRIQTSPHVQVGQGDQVGRAVQVDPVKHNNSNNLLWSAGRSR